MIETILRHGSGTEIVLLKIVAGNMGRGQPGSGTRKQRGRAACLEEVRAAAESVRETLR